MNKLILTPGPTEISEHVRAAMARPITNPDLDPEFFAFYDRLCGKIGTLLHTKNQVLVLSGEGILGLEAAVASLVEPGDEVLVLDNGVFGHGFADFVTMYGGTPVFLTKDYRQSFAAEDLEQALAKHPAIKIATMVHCDTPSAMLNPLEEIVPVLKQHGILTIVDAVASMGGDPVLVDEWGIDIVLGGSQKAFSAPPGLTIVAISKAAWAKMEQRRNPIPGFYVNLLNWKTTWLKDRVFPYTQPISDLYALDAAIDGLLAEGDAVYERHFQVAEATRQTLIRGGFELYPQDGASADTVTAFLIPQGLDDAKVRQHLWDRHGVMIAGSWGDLAGKVWRIGHMGENARPEKVFRFFLAFEQTLNELDYDRAFPLAATFAEMIQLAEM